MKESKKNQEGAGFFYRFASAAVFALLCLCGLALSLPARATVWDMDMPLPKNDPQWQKVNALWAKHYDDKTLDDLIAALTPLKDKYPDTIEPYIWLARAHYLHGRKMREGRQEHYEQAEKLAAQALKMDPKNQLAIKILFDTLSYSRDHTYIFNNYGAMLKSVAPLAGGEALPDMKHSPDWDAFRKLWDQRVDIEKAKTAEALMEKIADANPNDGLAQSWASYAAYHIGEYYTGANEHDAKGIPYYKKGIAYGEKARKLLPYSVEANYWYQNSLARSIQFTSLANQARYLMDLLRPLLFCSYENNSYFYYSPTMTLATMITNGGWVTEKGMQIAGITLENELNGLEIAEILCPTFYYIPYARADVLSAKGRKKEALDILEKLLAKDPDIDPVLIADNHTYLNLARLLYNDIKSGKR